MSQLIAFYMCLAFSLGVLISALIGRVVMDVDTARGAVLVGVLGGVPGLLILWLLIARAREAMLP